MSERPTIVCSHCYEPITFWAVPRCKACNKPLCPPILRDCAIVHWNRRHAERDVETVKGP